MTQKQIISQFLLIAFVVALLTGCDGPVKVVPNNPSDRLNPAMSAEQKQRMLHRG